MDVTFVTDRVVDEDLTMGTEGVSIATGTEDFGPFNNTDYGGTDYIVSD